VGRTVGRVLADVFCRPSTQLRERWSCKIRSHSDQERPTPSLIYSTPVTEGIRAAQITVSRLLSKSSSSTAHRTVVFR
jgi:hypothetical protein